MADAHDLFETNFFGAARLIDAVLPAMRARHEGRIINIGSLAAWVGEPGEAFYAASKAALARYTEALHHELWPLGVHVSLVEPGAFRTSIAHAPTTVEGTIADYDRSRESARRTLQEAARHGGDPRRVARLVRQIAQARSPRFRYGVGAGGAAIARLRVLLPQRVFDRVLRRSYGLEPPQPRRYA